MDSLKQRGNQAFREKRYKDAIKLYTDYVSSQHSDNNKAFFNLGLCHTKLNQKTKSIQFYKKSLQSDSSYQKAYYRLMLDHAQLGNTYEAFINACLYVKYQKDHKSQSWKQANLKLKSYKKQFQQKSSKNIKRKKKISEDDGFMKIIDTLKPILEQSPDYISAIDKYPDQWIEQWSAGVQSQDAKWEEIAYVTQQIDKQYGQQLGYFYLNQIQGGNQKKQIADKIKELKKEIFSIDESNQSIDLEEQINFEKQLIRNQIATQVPSQINLSEKLPQTAQSFASKTKKIQAKKDKNIDNSEKTGENIVKKAKPEDLLQLKSQNKTIIDDKKIIPQIKQPEKKKQRQQVIKDIRKQEKQIRLFPSQNQKVNNRKQTDEEKIQITYLDYCGIFQKTKDIFTQLYKSVFHILKSKQDIDTKGKLLIMIKKRVKRFKLIVTSFSQNQQKALYDMLLNNKMEQYAVDYAPSFHKL